MSKRKIVAGNWKMNLTVEEGVALVSGLINKGLQKKVSKTEVILAPPMLHLLTLRNLVQNSAIKISAQNCSDRVSGAFTGEVSVSMLAGAHIEYVIIGHSERRIYFHESNVSLKEKVDLALEYGVTPIFCCGEPKEIRIDEKQDRYVFQQIEESLFHLNEEQISKVIIAYEPVWAIGTGLTATPEQAEAMHAYIRKEFTNRYNADTANAIPILYGGSVNAVNAKSLFNQPNVDGGLVGGASLKVDEFYQIIQAAQ